MQYGSKEIPTPQDLITIDGVLYGVRTVRDSAMEVTNMQTRERSTMRLPTEGLEIVWRCKVGDKGLMHPRCAQSMRDINAPPTDEEEVMLEERRLFFEIIRSDHEHVYIRMSSDESWWVHVDCLLPFKVGTKIPSFSEVMEEPSVEEG